MKDYTEIKNVIMAHAIGYPLSKCPLNLFSCTYSLFCPASQPTNSVRVDESYVCPRERFGEWG